MTEEVVKKRPGRPRKTTQSKAKVTTEKINVKSLQKVGEKKIVENPTSIETQKASQVVDKKTDPKGEAITSESLSSYLPENYEPQYFKHGIGAGFLMIPVRVFNFLDENPSNWYLKIDEYPYFSGKDFLHAILYYIIHDGFVNIQELGNNQFYKLTINQSGSVEPSISI